MRKLERSNVSMLVRRFRSRALVELENLALRHQRAQDPGLDVWRKFYARTCAANPTNLAQARER